MKALLSALVVSMLLTGCAFQLRDDVALPAVMESTYVEFEGTNQRALRAIARALALSDVSIARRPEGATAVLEIVSMLVSRRTLLKDSRGRARESSVSVSIAYRLRAPDGFVLVDTRQVERQASVVLEPTDPLSSAGELASTTETLRDEAVWDMLYDLANAELAVREETEPQEEEPTGSERE